MKISKPQIIQENKQVTYQANVESTKGSKTLWYSLHESYSDLLSNSCDACLVALLIPAMAVGEDIYIDGMISERLLYNLSGPLQKVLQHIIPSLRQINIYPEEICLNPAKRAPGVATGFSAGIDSYCVLADHYYSNVLEGFKITHFIFNNVGSGGGSARLNQKRYQRLLPITERLGLPFVRIDSNLNSFYAGFDKEIRFQKTRGLFQQTHTLRNVSVALLLQCGIGRYMYASTVKYTDAFVGSTYDIAYSDPITLPLLSTDTLDAFSVGSQYSRVEKTLRVAEVADSYKTLDVCVHDTSGYTNCSKCWKCLRTLATLDIAGYIEHYSDSFDLNVYEEHKNGYFATLRASHDPLLMEIVEFAKERNYSFPISSYVIRISRTLGVYPMARLSKHTLLKLKHLITRYI